MALGEHLQVGGGGPAAGAAVQHRHLSGITLGARQAHRQIGQAVGVEIADPGGQHAAVVVVDVGDAQPHRRVIKGIHPRAQVGRRGRRRQVATLVGHAGEGKGGVRPDGGGHLPPGAAIDDARRRDAIDDDLLRGDVAGVARAIEGAHAHLVSALRADAHLPVVGPGGVRRALALEGHAAPRLAANGQLDPLDAGQVVRGGAAQSNDGAVHVRRQGGRGGRVVHRHVHRVRGLYVAHGVGRPGLQAVDAVRRQAPGIGPGAQAAAQRLQVVWATLGHDAQFHIGEPGGGVACRAAHDIVRAAQERAIGRREDGDLGRQVIDDHRPGALEGHAGVREGQPQVAAIPGDGRGHARRDRRGGELVGPERVGAGKGPTHALDATSRDRRHGWRAVAREDAALDPLEPIGQVERHRAIHGIRRRVGDPQRDRHLLAGAQVQARATARHAADRRDIHAQRRDEGVGGVRAQAVGLLLRVVKDVGVAVGHECIGGDPRLPIVGQVHGPAADHGAGLHPAHLFAVREAVAVAVRHVGEGADAPLQAVVQPVAVGVREQGIGAEGLVHPPLVIVREPIPIGIGVIRGGAEHRLHGIGEAVSVPVRVAQGAPVPQAVEIARDDVQGEF